MVWCYAGSTNERPAEPGFINHRLTTISTHIHTDTDRDTCIGSYREGCCYATNPPKTIRIKLLKLLLLLVHVLGIHYTTRHYTTLHYITLYYTILLTTILHNTTLHYTTLVSTWNSPGDGSWLGKGSSSLSIRGNRR